MATSGLMAKGVPAGLPPFLFFVKIAILVLSLVILALAAYSISVFSSYYYGYGGVGGLLIFVVIKTLLIYGALLFIELRAQHLFYRIIAAIGYVVSIIFWLSAWAWAASTAAWYLSWFGYGYGVVDTPFKAAGGALAACAGLGAVVWILSIVNCVFFIRACLRDGGATQNQAELGQFQNKQNEAPYASTPAPVQYQAQPVYQQQQQYPQATYQQAP